MRTRTTTIHPLRCAVIAAAMLIAGFSLLAVVRASQSVSLAWVPDASGSPPSGFYVYWGAKGVSYTNKVDVGTNTSLTLTNLQEGVTYFFSASSYTFTGIESVLTPEVDYLTPCALNLLSTNIGGTQSVCLRFSVAPSYQYTLQTSSNLTDWSDLWQTYPLDTNGWIEFTEPCSTDDASRFYRLVEN